MKKVLLIFSLAVLLVPAAGAFPLAQTDEIATTNWTPGQPQDPIRVWLIGNIDGEGRPWRVFFLATESRVMSLMEHVFEAFPVLQRLEDGTINLYQVTFGGDPRGIQFDIFGYIDCENGTFTPVGNDHQTTVPEPSTVIGLLTLGIGGLVGRSKVFRRK